MDGTRLEVRLDRDHRKKLEALAAAQGRSISVVVRELIDAAYQHKLQGDRLQAARRIADLSLEPAPDPRTLADQIARAYELPDLY